jgi:prepilin signal peptidase PulO-like enzyme (type II secretory pathway)
MDCVYDYECGIDEICVASECTSNSDMVFTQLGIYAAMALVAALLALFFPLRDTNTGRDMKCVSVIVALFFFPLYVVGVAAQNQIRTDGRANVGLTVVVALCFWPLLFCMMPNDGWSTRLEAYKVNQVV